MTGSPQDLDGVGIDELKRLLLEALAKISELTEKNAALRAEVARLKGLNLDFSNARSASGLGL